MDVSDLVKSGLLMLLGSLIIPGIKAGFVWLTGRARTKRDNVERLETKIDGLWRRLRIRDDYVSELRQHINTQKPPPPPDYPDNY